MPCTYFLVISLHLQQDELAKKAKEEHAKKIKHLRAELEKAEGENCDKPIEKEMAKIDENEKNCSEPEASFETVNMKQKVPLLLNS